MFLDPLPKERYTTPDIGIRTPYDFPRADSTMTLQVALFHNLLALLVGTGDGTVQTHPHVLPPYDTVLSLVATMRTVDVSIGTVSL